jgi:hypothetical protein
MNAKKLNDSVGVQTPAEKPEPPADTTDFLEVIYRVSSGIIRAQIRRGEFD